ncbi:hypothetical protein ABOZ73_08385 [Caulobacter sp. 73W]|uniref:Uncharacterized protein n=1 Tax=Caulobacter sp. 73W TaxID=3161137 RepID=A0AB39KWQ3_9CAUL
MFLRQPRSVPGTSEDYTMHELLIFTLLFVFALLALAAVLHTLRR